MPSMPTLMTPDLSAKISPREASSSGIASGTPVFSRSVSSPI
jgi:hypothetical protein